MKLNELTDDRLRAEAWRRGFELHSVQFSLAAQSALRELEGLRRRIDELGIRLRETSDAKEHQPDERTFGEHVCQRLCKLQPGEWTMAITPSLRKLALTAHVTSSVGWLGAAASFLALAIAAGISPNKEMVRGTYIAMELTGWYVIVPFCLAALITGLVISLVTPWGLFRYYWVLVKLLLTVVAALILFGFTQTLGSLGDLAGNPGLSLAELRTLNQSPALHSGGGLVVLLATTVLAVYKPWGRTAYGRRKMGMDSQAGADSNNQRWGRYLLVGGIILIVVFLTLHLAHGGARGD